MVRSPGDHGTQLRCGGRLGSGSGIALLAALVACTPSVPEPWTDIVPTDGLAHVDAVTDQHAFVAQYAPGTSDHELARQFGESLTGHGFERVCTLAEAPVASMVSSVQVFRRGEREYVLHIAWLVDGTAALGVTLTDIDGESDLFYAWDPVRCQRSTP